MDWTIFDRWIISQPCVDEQQPISPPCVWTTSLKNANPSSLPCLDTIPAMFGPYPRSLATRIRVPVTVCVCVGIRASRPCPSLAVRAFERVSVAAAARVHFCRVMLPVFSSALCCVLCAVPMPWWWWCVCAVMCLLLLRCCFVHAWSWRSC